MSHVIRFAVFIIVGFVVSCSSGGKQGPTGKRCAKDFDPVDAGLYEVDESKPNLPIEEREVAAKVKQKKIVGFHDIDFSDLEPGTYKAISTFVILQQHLEGQSDYNYEDGRYKPGTGFKVAALEREATLRDDSRLVSDDETVVEIYCLRGFNKRQNPDQQFSFEMKALREVVVTKDDETPKFFIDSGTYLITDGHAEEGDPRGYFHADMIESSELDSKPSDYFKSGDANGSDYNAALYAIEGANDITLYEYHAEINVGNYTAQSRVILRKMTPEELEELEKEKEERRKLRK